MVKINEINSMFTKNNRGKIKKTTSIKRNVLLVEVVLLYHHNIELK